MINKINGLTIVPTSSTLTFIDPMYANATTIPADAVKSFPGTYGDVSPADPVGYNYRDVFVTPGQNIQGDLPHVDFYPDDKTTSRIKRRLVELDRMGKRDKLLPCYIGDLSVNYDTETTTVYKYATKGKNGKYKKGDTNPDGSPKILEAYGYRYYFQIGIGDVVFHCRTWEVAADVFAQIADAYGLHTPQTCFESGRFLRVLHANSSFEFQFIRKDLQLFDSFADSDRHPLTFTTVDGFYWQDALRLCNGSLSGLAKAYNTPTKKRGDLDYTVPRNSQTVLTPQEIAYCSADVRILAEVNQYIIENYVKNGYPYPLTATGFIRHDVKKRWSMWMYNTKTNKKTGKTTSTPTKELRTVSLSYPQTYAEYQKATKYLFQGGYTHANFMLADDILTNVNGSDFTSSYPYSDIFQKFPTDVWEPITNPTADSILSDCDDYAYRFTICLKGLKPKTSHSIISLSKTFEYDALGSASDYVEKYNAVIDNGRILATDCITIMATDLDLQTLEDAYTWASATITDCYRSKYGYLPDAIRYTMAKYYMSKAALKRQGLDGTTEYKFAKGQVNAGYGMMCEHLHFNNTKYNENTDEWETDTTNPAELETKYQSEMFNKSGIARTPFNPYWGIWTTSHARRNLLKNLLCSELSVDGAYCDTDSIYYINPDEHQPYFDAYNDSVTAENVRKVQAWNKAHGFDETYYSTLTGDDAKIYMLEHAGLIADLVSDLGTFDKINKHGNYTRFKTLGAKRYVKEYEDGTFEQTIAGLPKDALANYINEQEAKTGEHIDVFELIQHGMYIPNCKNCHKYNDKQHSHVITDTQGHSETMTEQSSVGIFPIGFRLGLAPDYLDLLTDKNLTPNERRDPVTNVSDLDINRLQLVAGFLELYAKTMTREDEEHA